jgi:threonine aldolase
MRPVDFRSDTVTQPTPAMKAAMTEAPLGDDVLGDDPTVQALEERAAQFAGKEAALFVPSGTMANLLAILVSTRPGDEVLLHRWSHPFNYEAAGAAMVAGVQLSPLDGPRGMLEPATVLAAIRPVDDHCPPAALVSVEDTTNRGGGAVHPLALLDAVGAAARAKGLATHMDGARACNAVVASGIPLARRATAYDSISMCFSKGLGAPAGSVLCADQDRIHVARRRRKMLGGGMRQSGVLAAAALYALEHHVERLADDHRRAATLATGLARLGLKVVPPDTNMVFVEVADAPAWQDRMSELGIRLLAAGPTTLRLVTHLDVDDDGIQAAVQAFGSLVRASA